MSGSSLAEWKMTVDRYDKMVVRTRSSLREEKVRREESARMHKTAVEKFLARISVVDKASEVVQMAVDELSKKGIAEMESMLTAAVSAAFTDRDYGILINVDDRGKDKKAEIVLLQEQRESGLDCNGDGLSAILSFVTRQFFVVRFGRARLLFMDEPMNELSPRFLKGIASFIRTLIEELGFVVVIITHARSQFLPVADKVYWAEEGGKIRHLYQEEIEKVMRGENPNE